MTLTPAWSPNRDWAGCGWHPGRRKDIAAGAKTQAGRPPWRPSKRKGPDPRRIGYRVHACCMGMGLPRSASNRCRCRSQCRASVRKITNATRASRAVPAWLETTRPQMSRTRKKRLSKVLRERRNSLEPQLQAAFRAGSQAPRTGRFCSVKGGRPLMSNWP